MVLLLGIWRRQILYILYIYIYIYIYIYDYDSGGYVYEQPSRINCSIWLDASQRSRDGVCVKRSVREVKCKAL